MRFRRSNATSLWFADIKSFSSRSFVDIVQTRLHLLIKASPLCVFKSRKTLASLFATIKQTSVVLPCRLLFQTWLLHFDRPTCKTRKATFSQILIPTWRTIVIISTLSILNTRNTLNIHYILLSISCLTFILMEIMLPWPLQQLPVDIISNCTHNINYIIRTKVINCRLAYWAPILPVSSQKKKYLQTARTNVSTCPHLSVSLCRCLVFFLFFSLFWRLLWSVPNVLPMMTEKMV